jgi:uncharacterized heparinase superfamily protein
MYAVGSEARSDWHRALIQTWIDDNPPGQGVGWAPYPTSLRIVNWIKWQLSGQTLGPEALHSLAIQARWLRSRLEIHLLGNHLFANAKALVFAGLYFSGPDAARWLEKGLAILDQELPEQILADGGHFELSPMYHCIILEVLLDLINLHDVYADEYSANDNDFAGIVGTRVAGWRSTVLKMHRWLNTMCHPDNKISFFNDATFDVAPNPDELNAYAKRLGLQPAVESLRGVTRLPASGFTRLQNETAVVLVDAGKIGADYIPGHAHADTLSFECCLAIFIAVSTASEPPETR